MATRTAELKVKRGLDRREFTQAVKTVKSMDGMYNGETQVWTVIVDDKFDEGVMSDPDYYGLVILFDSAAVEEIIEQIEPTVNETEISETIISQIEEQGEMSETTVTREMIANGTAPKLSCSHYPQLHEGETVTVLHTDEERLTIAEYRTQYPAMCFDEDNNPLPDEALNPIIHASTYIIGTNSPRLRREWAKRADEEEGF